MDEPTLVERLRESIVHGLRMRGWSRIEAENEADDRIEARRARALLQPSEGTNAKD
jgi:hypothetical protein